MNFFDITKSVTLVAVVAFLWFHGNAIVSGFSTPSIPAAIIETIDSNALKLASLTASNKKVDDLRKEFESKNSKILAEYEKQTNEVLEELGEVKAEQKQTRDLINRQSDKITNPKNEKLAYEFKKIYAKDTEGKKFPVAWVMYFPNQSDDKRWKTGTYPLEYHTKIIETENRDGTFNRYAEIHLENNQMDETEGNQYPIKLENIEWAKVEKKERSWMWWNPRLGFGLIASPDYVAPTFDISMSSYGRTGVDLDWRFISLGLGLEKESDGDLVLIGSFEPCSWNIGKALPLIENMFVGPVWSIDTNSETKLGVKTVIPF
jgi:hypothetical protein